MRASTVAAAVIIAVLVPVVHVAAQNAPDSFVTGEILVRFRPGVAAGDRAAGHRQAGGVVLNEILSTGVQLVEVDAGDELAAIARYENNPNVLYAEPNFVRSVPEPSAHAPGTEVLPSDYYFTEQWALHNTGQYFYCLIPNDPYWCFYVGTPDADIDAPEAWAISSGGANARVAVIDTGIDSTHPDLAANYVGGWDLVHNDSNPFDDHGHGTHVAGTIAALMSNKTGSPEADEGVVGVAPNAEILSYKVCDANGYCDDFRIEQAIDRAIIDGAQVINLSLGGPDFSQSTLDAVLAARNANVLVVAGAGNDGSTSYFYPAAYDTVISVGASDEDDLRAAFSNFGNWVDIAAPGNVIMSTYPVWGCGGLTNMPGDTGCYAWNSGTSMATPHVAGAAALVWARPDVITADQVEDILLGSADAVGVGAQRLDAWTIHGGLNIHNAINYGATNIVPTADAGEDQVLVDSENDGEWVDLAGSGIDPDGSIVSYLWREGAEELAYEAHTQVLLSIGTHVLTLEVTDDRGAVGTDNVVVVIDSSEGAPPVAADVGLVATAGVPVLVTLSASDSGTCELEFSIVPPGPSEGTTGPVQPQTCVPGTPNTDTATVSFTSDTTGVSTFTYVASDESGATSAAATVTITVVEPSATTVGVASIAYDTSGGKNGDRHLNITLIVQDDLGQAVSGAVVSISVWNLDTFAFGNGADATDSTGAVTFSWKNAPAGCYETIVETVEVAGLVFDGATPANSLCK